MVVANIAWAIAYDTAYAMVDREDDLKIGIRTSAITFGRHDVTIMMLCYLVVMICFAWLGAKRDYSIIYWIFYAIAGLLIAHYYILIRGRDRARCFLAFRRNNWLGACLFLAIALA